jgi:hypothetical protein
LKVAPHPYSNGVRLRLLKKLRQQATSFRGAASIKSLRRAAATADSRHAYLVQPDRAAGDDGGLVGRQPRGFREKTRSGLNAGGAAPCEGNQGGPCQLPFNCPAPIDSAAVGFDNDK